MTDADLGRALLQAGLAERAVLACFGVSCVAHVPRGRAFAAPPPAATAALLLGAGATVPLADARRALGPALDALVARDLVAIAGDRARATVTILPAGPRGALAVADRWDAPTLAAIPPPDDSSHHLVAALPERRVARWLDVGTGTAWAPLAAAGRAADVVATDVAPRAIELAGLGAALSGVRLDLRVGDLATAVDGRFDLVTFNAPIPPPGGDELLPRFWRDAPRLVAPGGEVLVHAVVPDDLAAHPAAGLGGALVVARYTPPGARGFAISAWRPGAAPAAPRLVEIALSPAAPHVPRAAVL